MSPSGQERLPPEIWLHILGFASVWQPLPPCSPVHGHPQRLPCSPTLDNLSRTCCLLRECSLEYLFFRFHFAFPAADVGPLAMFRADGQGSQNDVEKISWYTSGHISPLVKECVVDIHSWYEADVVAQSHVRLVFGELPSFTNLSVVKLNGVQMSRERLQLISRIAAVKLTNCVFEHVNHLPPATLHATQVEVIHHERGVHDTFLGQFYSPYFFDAVKFDPTALTMLTLGELRFRGFNLDQLSLWDYSLPLLEQLSIDVKPLPGQSLERMLSLCPRLTSLTWFGRHPSVDFVAPTDWSSLLPQIAHFRGSFIPPLPDNGTLRDLHVDTFGIFGVMSSPNAEIGHILEYPGAMAMKKLESFRDNWASLNMESLKSLADACPHLRALHLDFLLGLTASFDSEEGVSTIPAILRSISAVPFPKSLEYLAVGILNAEVTISKSDVVESWVILANCFDSLKALRYISISIQPVGLGPPQIFRLNPLTGVHIEDPVAFNDYKRTYNNHL